MYLNHATWAGRDGSRASQPVAKITIDPEPCMAMLLEKLRKSDRSLGGYCLCVQHTFKDQPWMLRVSGDTRSAARNSQAYRSNVPYVPLIALISLERLHKLY